MRVHSLFRLGAPFAQRASVAPALRPPSKSAACHRPGQHAPRMCAAQSNAPLDKMHGGCGRSLIYLGTWTSCSFANSTIRERHVGRVAGRNRSRLHEIKGVPRRDRPGTPARRGATISAAVLGRMPQPGGNDMRRRPAMRLLSSRAGIAAWRAPAPPKRHSRIIGSCQTTAPNPAHRLAALPEIREVAVGPATPAVIGAPGIGWILTRSATPSIALLHRQIHRQKSVPVSNPQLPPDFEGKQSAWQEGISSRFNEVWRCTSRQNSGRPARSPGRHRAREPRRGPQNQGGSSALSSPLVFLVIRFPRACKSD